MNYSELVPRNLQQIIYDIFFFFNDTATTEIYTLSLHDALPISLQQLNVTNFDDLLKYLPNVVAPSAGPGQDQIRSEEHTSELQSQSNLVCRLLLEKKNHNHDDSIAPCTTQLHALLHGTPVPHIC